MIRTGKWGIAAIAAFALVIAVSAQDASPTAAQIIDKYVAAIGGKVNLEKIHSRHYKGTFEIPDFGATGTVEYIAKAPNKSITIVDIVGYGITRNSFDGANAWAESPQAGMTDLTGEQLLNSKRSAEFYSSLKFHEMYPKMSVKGKEKSGARDVWVVLANYGAGPDDSLYFDAETGLLLRATRTRDSDQGPVVTDTFYDEYKPFDGVQVVTVQRRVTSQFTSIARFTDIKHNVPVEDTMFVKPTVQ